MKKLLITLILTTFLVNIRGQNNSVSIRSSGEKKDKTSKVSNYKFLQSNPIDSFDYVCYAMQRDNSRYREEKSDGSVANIKIIDNSNIQITLKQADGRIWTGELFLKTRNYGEMSLIYNNSTEIEVGRKECYIGQIIANGYREDVFYFKPLTDTQAYGDEIMVRKSKLK